MSNLQQSSSRLEFYEYDIEGYGFDFGIKNGKNIKSHQVYFSDFRKREIYNENERRIRINQKRSLPKTYNTDFEYLESSIDPILSIDIDLDEKLHNFPENQNNKLNFVTYLKKYREWLSRAKITSHLEKSSSNKVKKIINHTNLNFNFYTIPRKNKIIETIQEATLVNFDYLKHNTSSINFTSFNKLNNPLELDEATKIVHQNAFIYHLKLNDEKLIVFGDFHGSFHTFIRNISRLHVLGVLELSEGKFKINNGYVLIFLGDIVDRGNYGLDILFILSKLIIENNNKDKLKIIINRGNHEEIDTYLKYGFKNEYNLKIKDSKKYNLDLLFFKFFTFLPSALIVDFDEKTRYWMCHGGIPYVSEEYKLNIDEIINSGQKIIYIDDENLSKQIRWNDFNTNNDETIFNKKRGVGYLIGYNYFKIFCDLNKINMIIRGHNDSYFNSFIFYRNPRYSNLPIYNLSKVPLNDNVQVPTKFLNYVEYKQEVNSFFSKKPKNEFKDFNLSKGAVAMLDIDKFNNKNISKTDYNFVPIVTISTNTDNDRNLTRDSFLLINPINQRTNNNTKNYGLFSYNYIMQENRKNINNIIGISPNNNLQQRNTINILESRSTINILESRSTIHDLYKIKQKPLKNFYKKHKTNNTKVKTKNQSLIGRFRSIFSSSQKTQRTQG